MASHARPVSAPPPGTASAKPQLSRAVPLLFLITGVTGVVDAVCYLFLGHVFSAYVTGTIVLAGIRIGGGNTSALAPYAVSFAGFVLGAVCGGRLSRSIAGLRQGFVTVLSAEAVLLIAAASTAIAEPVTSDAVGRSVVLGLAGASMGAQICATKRLDVPDMTLPAATGIIHGLMHDSRAAGGTPQRARRRLGVVLALAIGAVGGAAVAHWSVAGALFCAALIVLGVAITASRVL
jgi:uncharacterized membrane protein YoaK (UPF0700 family)